MHGREGIRGGREGTNTEPFGFNCVCIVLTQLKEIVAKLELGWKMAGWDRSSDGG